MKRIITLLVLLTMALTIDAQDKDATIYLVKSGHIEYELTGNVAGTKTVWWDNFGEWLYEEEKTVTKIKFLGQTSEEQTHTISIVKDGVFWNANMIEKTGVTGKEDVSEMHDEFDEMDEKELEEFGKELFDAMGGRKLPPEKFLGRTCDVIVIMGTKSYIYKNILLKSTAKIMGIEANVTATKFNENISIPVSKFAPVSGIDYVEVASDEDWF
jgi:hypothetical protein